MLRRGQTPSRGRATSSFLDRKQPQKPVEQQLDAHEFRQLDRKPTGIEIVGASSIGFVISYLFGGDYVLYYGICW